MDALLSSFDSTIKVSFDEFDTYSNHPRFDQYKCNSYKKDQEERRQQTLEENKQKRVELLNIKRGLTEEVVRDIERSLNKKNYVKKTIVDRFKMVLMLSEWLVDVPDDFNEQWIAVPCPVGRRVMVVVENNMTYVYTRKGYPLLSKFTSGLPHNFSIPIRLDCIWHQPSTTLYIVDTLSFGPELVNCEAELRFAWLSWKCQELNLDVVSEKNKYRFLPLERFNCTELQSVMTKPFLFHGDSLPIDGFMFFHREGLYMEYGRSPLVTWLKPHMIEGLLNLKQVHSSYKISLPAKTLKMDTSPPDLSLPST